MKQLIEFFFSKKIYGGPLITKKEIISEITYDWAIKSSKRWVFLKIAASRPSFLPTSDCLIFSFGDIHECVDASTKLCETIIEYAIDNKNHKVFGEHINKHFDKWEFRISRETQMVCIIYLGYNTCGLLFPVKFFEMLSKELDDITEERKKMPGKI
ncbi:MAG: hypothetical protein V4599_03680 [Verrucomicrobiota bacterium]